MIFGAGSQFLGANKIVSFYIQRGVSIYGGCTP